MTTLGKDAFDLNRRVSQRPVQRICVIKPSAFGDVVQSLPLLNVLRARFPQSRISWVINRELTALIDDHPTQVEPIHFERRGGVSSWWRLLRELRAARFDLVFDLQGLLRTGLMMWATGSPMRIGLQTAREGSHFACHNLVPGTGRDVPAHQRCWRIAEELGMGHLLRRADLFTPEADLRWAQQLKTNFRGPMLVVHPGARWETKKWPIAHYAQVIREAIRTLGMNAVVVGSRDEAAAAAELVDVVQPGVPRGSVVNLAGQTSIRQLAALMQQADLVLSNDSGPMHLADAMGAPVVGIFTCTSPTRSGPPGPQHQLLAADVPCAASYCKTCPNSGRKHLACFRELTPERVSTALQLHWNRVSSHQRAS